MISFHTPFPPSISLKSMDKPISIYVFLANVSLTNLKFILGSTARAADLQDLPRVVLLTVEEDA